MMSQRRHAALAALILLLAAATNQHVSAFSTAIGGSGPMLRLGAPVGHRSPASIRLPMVATGDGNKSKQKPPATAPSTPLTTASEPPGLGGSSGIRPDVNSLKRNLVQEAVRAYKSELLELLGTPHGGRDYFQPTAAAMAGTTTGNRNSNPTAASSPLYANGSSAETQLYDEARDGAKPVSYYKYGPGAAAYGRTYAGEWATRDELIEDKLAALVQVRKGAVLKRVHLFIYGTFRRSARMSRVAGSKYLSVARDVFTLDSPLSDHSFKSNKQIGQPCIYNDRLQPFGGQLGVRFQFNKGLGYSRPVSICPDPYRAGQQTGQRERQDEGVGGHRQQGGRRAGGVSSLGHPMRKVRKSSAVVDTEDLFGGAQLRRGSVRC